jgi:ATP-dependent Clp protease protease subunit
MGSVAKLKAPGYSVAMRGDTATIYLYGQIGASFFGDGITAKQFADDLGKLKSAKTIDVRINSEGGDVFEAKTIYSLLNEHKARVNMHIDGLAASSASFIAMAGDSIAISEGGFMMIHNAWTISAGNAADMRATANLLDNVDASIVAVYSARTGLSAPELENMMAAETWLNSEDAIKHGFATEVIQNQRVAASVRDPSRFKHLPKSLLPKRAAVAALLENFRTNN